MFEEPNQVITSSRLTLPAFELVLLMVLLALSLLFRYSRTGILIAYLFAYRWGWAITKGLGKEAQLGYLIFGMVVGVLAVIGLFAETRE